MKLDFTSVLAYIKDIQYIYLLVEVWTVCSHSTIFCLYVCQLSPLFLMLCCFFIFLSCCFCLPFLHAPTASCSLSVFEAASRCRTESLLLGFCSWPTIRHNCIYSSYIEIFSGKHSAIQCTQVTGIIYCLGLEGSNKHKIKA